MIVTRFAPSPTGYLHLGHAYAACIAQNAAKLQSDGRFLLRIEDIDAARCKPEFEAAIFEDLAWLGLDWEKPVLRQSERFDAYRAALGNLEAQGLLYPCFCTRKEIAEEVARASGAPHSINLGPEGALYPGTCRKLSAAERKAKMAQGALYALRLDVEMAASMAGAITFNELGRGLSGETGTIAVNPRLFGDIVLARKETPAAYHLAVVVDDAFQNVTLVTRGHDLFAAAHVQRLLQTLLGLPAPSYGHHDLVLDEQGRKFSKRDNAVTLRALRESGVTPDEIPARIGLR
ncbi:MAG TPA: tRNA glutamyl-Q(34) synthetase GluQRS [Rhizomicrobium sp.]|jgi:glutamyl-Q tRNA(Asp) synthetase|nr:tRNA glutamyl-Q(34) synthetase GluQRS [Rhizomicrobium sp.]